jgi:hypothetical protein
VKTGFDERRPCRNAASNPFLERTIRPQSDQSGLRVLAIPLFQGSLNCPELVSIHLYLLRTGQLSDLLDRSSSLASQPF